MSSSVLHAAHLRFGSLFLITALALVCLALPQNLAAQVATTGKITGVVNDASGAGVPDATVTVKSTALFAPKSTTTQADGSFLFDLLPLGTYELSIKASGFRTFTQTGIVLTAGFTATANAKLQVGDVTESVSV